MDIINSSIYGEIKGTWYRKDTCHVIVEAVHQQQRRLSIINR